jgi:hypothetical protein
VRLMVPFPVPLPPLTVIHVGAPERVQEHPAPVVTVSVDGPPAAGAATEPGLTAYVHGGAVAAPCEIVKGCPAIVTTPDRVPPGFAATSSVIVPLPVPPGVPVTVIHAESLTADHEHPAPAVIATVVVVPDAAAVAPAGEML